MGWRCAAASTSSYPVFGDYTGWAISLHEIYAVVGKMTTEPESTQLAAPARIAHDRLEGTRVGIKPPCGRAP